VSEPPVLANLADDAYQAIRRINHLTVRGPAVPAPQLYEVLGSLKLLGPGLEQALTQLGDALVRSLAEYQVYEDDGADPASSVAACRAAITCAASRAASLGDILEQAQQAIARQGYRTPGD
jgi:hypothetical protein